MLDHLFSKKHQILKMWKKILKNSRGIWVIYRPISAIDQHELDLCLLKKKIKPLAHQDLIVSVLQSLRIEDGLRLSR